MKMVFIPYLPMPSIDLAAYKDLYLKTARDHVSNLKKNLDIINLDPDNKKGVFELFRLFHSLKSQNHFMGFEKSAHLCKVFEDYFRRVNDGEKKYLTVMTGPVTEAINKIENSLNEIEKLNTETDLSQDIINFENKMLNL